MLINYRHVVHNEKSCISYNTSFDAIVHNGCLYLQEHTTHQSDLNIETFFGGIGKTAAHAAYNDNLLIKIVEMIK